VCLITKGTEQVQRKESWGLRSSRMLCWLAVGYWRFGRTSQSHLRYSSILRRRHWLAWALQIGPIECPETSVNNQQHKPWDIPEGRGLQLYRVGSFKSLRQEATRINGGRHDLPTFSGIWELVLFAEAPWHNDSHVTLSPCRQHSLTCTRVR